MTNSGGTQRAQIQFLRKFRSFLAYSKVYTKCLSVRAFTVANSCANSFFLQFSSCSPAIRSKIRDVRTWFEKKLKKFVKKEFVYTVYDRFWSVAWNVYEFLLEKIETNFRAELYLSWQLAIWSYLKTGDVYSVRGFSFVFCSTVWRLGPELSAIRNSMTTVLRVKKD